MKVVESSLCYRAVCRFLLWIGTRARGSLLGRFLARLGTVLGPVFASSEVFGLQRIQPRPLVRVGPSWSPGVSSRPYLCCDASWAEAPWGGDAGAGLCRCRLRAWQGRESVCLARELRLAFWP
jgi:hypothetical protein